MNLRKNIIERKLEASTSQAEITRLYKVLEKLINNEN